MLTLWLAINDCRTAKGEAPLSYTKGPSLELLAYIAYRLRPQITPVEISEDGPKGA